MLKQRKLLERKVALPLDFWNFTKKEQAIPEQFLNFFLLFTKLRVCLY
jgi:hypothetical protein